MIDITIDWREFKTKFRGGEVDMQIRPLENWAYMALLPLVSGTGPIRGKDETSDAFFTRLTETERRKISEDALAIQRLGEKIFPDHVRAIQGITIDGQAVTFDQLGKVTALLPLANAIAGALFAITSIGEEAEKNCAAPCASPASASATAQSLPAAQPGGGSNSLPPATAGARTAETCRPEPKAAAS